MCCVKQQSEVYENAGRTLVAIVPIAKGSWITQYGGELIDIKTAKYRMSIGCGSHLLTVESQWTALDGVEVSPDDDCLGSFANSVGFDIPKEAKNAIIDSVYTGPDGIEKQRWLKATRDIVPGEEIIAEYKITF